MYGFEFSSSCESGDGIVVGNGRDNIPRAIEVSKGKLDPGDVLGAYRARLGGEPGQFNVSIPDKAVAGLRNVFGH